MADDPRTRPVVGPVKDEAAAHPVASVWRPVLAQVVRAFVRGDFALADAVPTVARPKAAQAEQMRDYVASYGETLTELNDETWLTSVAQWMGGWWDLLVDLRTVEAGRCDMVLEVRVEEADGGYRFQLHLVYVP